MLKIRFFYYAVCFLTLYFCFLPVLLLPSEALDLGQPLNQAVTQAHLERVRQRSFPELEGQQIQLGRFEEADSFFQSGLDLGQLVQGHWIYQIDVNPRFLELDCPLAALDAVLAHELSHTLDYHNGGVGGILGILWQLLWHPASYERHTDLQAIVKGYGPGLILYRQWQYQHLTSEQVKRKKTNYYSPEEITLILAILEPLDQQEKQQRIKLWLQQPPLNLEELQRNSVMPEHLDLFETML